PPLLPRPRPDLPQRRPRPRPAEDPRHGLRLHLLGLRRPPHPAGLPTPAAHLAPPLPAPVERRPHPALQVESLRTVVLLRILLTRSAGVLAPRDMDGAAAGLAGVVGGLAGVVGN